MAAQKGRGMLLKISNGASPPTFTTVGGIREKNLTINNETVDITTSNTAPWRQLLADAGMRSVSVSGSGVFEDEAAINTVEELALSGNLQEFQMIFGNSDLFQGLFQVASFQYAGAHNAEQTYNITLESAGIITLLRA